MSAARDLPQHARLRREYTASPAHLFGTQLCTLSDGPGSGLRVLEMYAGDVLRAQILLDRAGDIGRVEYRARPVSWTSPIGYANRSVSAADEVAFLRSFPGGLLSTCGLEHAFSAEVEDRGGSRNPHVPSRRYPLHGSIFEARASLRGHGVLEAEDGPIVWCETSAHQIMLFEESLLLSRRVELDAAKRKIRVRDVISNEGWSVTPIMLVYHMNYGYPLLDEGSRVVYTDASLSQGAEEDAITCPAPISHAPERVSCRPCTPCSSTDWSSASLVHATGDWGVIQRFRGDILRYHVLWEWFQSGAYVVGMEASSNSLEGRAVATERGEFSTLAPGERVGSELEWEFFG